MDSLIEVGQRKRFCFQEGTSIGYLKRYDRRVVTVAEISSGANLLMVRFEGEEDETLYMVGESELFPL